jgi:hypothetical protein
VPVVETPGASTITFSSFKSCLAFFAIFLSDVMEEKLSEKTARAAAGSDETESDHGNQSVDTKPCPLDHVDLDILSDSISVPRETVRNL